MGTLGGMMTEFSQRHRRMRNMTAICVVAIIAAVLQGCASSGTVAGPGQTAPTGTASSSPAASPTQTASPTGTASDSDTATTATTTALAASSSTTTAPAAPATGGWTPQGQLANPEQIDQVVNPDKSVTATWPKGAPAGKALTIKMRAARNGAKIVIHLAIDNESGQQVSMSEGVFTGGTVLDASGNDLNMDNFDPLWTLGSGSSDGNIDPGQPLIGDFVVDAPAGGSTLNAYWTQAVSEGGIMSGIILIRDIPIN